MKHLFNKIALVALTLASTAAFAHPGSNSLKCTSAAKSGSKQVITLAIGRANGTGFAPPSFEVTVNGQKTEIQTSDEMKQYGETLHNSPLGVIAVTANNWDDETARDILTVSVMAIPATVKAFDPNGKPVKWSLKREEDSCNEANGRATFKGVMSGYLKTNVKDDKSSKETTLKPPIVTGKQIGRAHV